MDQQIALYCFDETCEFDEVSKRLFGDENLTSSSKYLILKNKYYQTEVQLLDFNSLTDDFKTKEQLSNVHAVIIYADGLKVTCEQLDSLIEQFKDIGGEPRVLLCDNIDDDSEQYRSLLSWALGNCYELILTGEQNFRNQLIDSVSAYKWPERKSPNQNQKQNQNTTAGPQLNENVMNQLKDFDALLNKFRAFKNRPELRGDPKDKNIEEIAEILSRLLDDEDVENLLDEEGELSAHNN